MAMGRTMAYDGTAGNTVDGGARGTGPVLQPPVLKPLPPTPGAAPNILNTHNTEKGARILNGHVLGNRTATRPFPEEEKNEHARCVRAGCVRRGGRCLRWHHPHPHLQA